MNSHFQSSEMTSISTGLTPPARGFGGSRACEPIQAIPLRNNTIKAGMHQVMNSIRPEYSQSGRRRARLFRARNHQAKASVHTMTGMTTANMMVVASNRISFSLSPTGPCGFRTPYEQPTRSSAQAANEQGTRRQEAVGIKARPSR